MLFFLTVDRFLNNFYSYLSKMENAREGRLFPSDKTEETVSSEVYETSFVKKPETLRDRLNRHLLVASIVIGCGVFAHKQAYFPKHSFPEYVYEQTPDYIIEQYIELWKTLERAYQSGSRLLD